MAKKIKFESYQEHEIRVMFSKAKKLKNARDYRRLQVLNMRRLGKTNAEISEATGYNTQYITDLVSKYVKEGIDSIFNNHYTSHNRRMTFEKETEFLEQFKEDGESGKIITAEKIQKKFEEATGKEVYDTTIYKLLKRHGWRKVKPRPRHPGAVRFALKTVIFFTKFTTAATRKICRFFSKLYLKNFPNISFFWCLTTPVGI